MRITILAVLSCLAVSGCDRSERHPQHDFGGATMGTTFNVTVVAPAEDVAIEELPQLLRQTLDEIEAQTSTYMPESELSLFNSSTSTDWVKVSQRLCEIIAQAQDLSRETHGAFDITVGPLVNLWGFGPGDSRDEPPDASDIDALLARVGFNRLQTDCAIPALRKSHAGLYVDLSAWAKGYAADELATGLLAAGINNFLVEVGGELRVQGHNARGQAWAVAIEKPSPDGREIQSVLRISNTGLATSGDYRNYFEHAGLRYSHTIDPRSGRPVTHQLASVTVMHASAAKADGLATALLVLGSEDGLALATELGVEAIFLVRTAHGLETISSRPAS
jgi:thiamine biosynthesis lipoprotein